MDLQSGLNRCNKVPNEAFKVELRNFKLLHNVLETDDDDEL